MVDVTEAELRSRARQLVDEVDSSNRIAYRSAQFDRGLAWVHFPVGIGGLGLPAPWQSIVHDELGRAAAVYDDIDLNPIGIGMAAPVILEHGTRSMQERFLKRIFTGEDIWCQMFSEPDAGSDVASLSTRAERDGDSWVVNGQKVWTTLAHVSNWGLLLARTDLDVPKHRGLSYFVVDMRSPGVDVRPLMQLTGEAEFNEVYFTDVCIPSEQLVGVAGDGWSIAITTLMNERMSLGNRVESVGVNPLDPLLELSARFDGHGSESAVMRDRLARLWIESEVLRLTNARARATASDDTPSPSASISKLMFAELNQRLGECAVDLLGATGMLYESGYPMERVDSAMLRGLDPPKMFLRMRAQSIEGGTSEIMRNILGERVLGLPKEPANDRDRPWGEAALGAARPHTVRPAGIE